ncbi:MAG: alpha/beta hydrolase [Anaerolineae bacterium]|nr:alpha/beta hydrolase [Anaerolineae bacterium]
MTREKSGHLEVSGGKVYYEMGGSGVPVVMVHAGFVDSGMWDAQWQALTQHFRVIRYDMRGYGKSDPLREPICRRDELYQVLTQLDVNQAHIIGCSMGGEIGIDFALEHPDLVTSLIAVSATPSGFALQGEPPRYLMDMIETAQKGDVERTSELQIRIWIDGMYREPEQVDTQVREQAAAMNIIPIRNGTWFVESQPLNPLNPPAVERLGDIRVPTLLMAGGLDHPEILRAADVMEQAIAEATKVIIPNTAHMPNMEQPATFNRAVLDFLGAREG